MTIEQEFFEAFGIEPKQHKSNRCLNIDYCGVLEEEPPKMKFVCDKCENKNIKEVVLFETYPPITPEIVLGLMTLLFNFTLKKYPKTTGLNFDIKRDIKEQILSGCVHLKDEIQDQVNVLFNA